MNYFYNQDPKYWLRLVTKTNHYSTKNKTSHQVYYIHSSEFTGNYHSWEPHYEYHPNEPGKFKHLETEYPCYLKGGITDESIYPVFENETIQEDTFTEVFSIYKWKNYWRNKKREEAIKKGIIDE